VALPPDQMLLGNSLLAQPSIASPWNSLDSQDRFFFSSGFGSMRRTEEYLPAFDPSTPLTMGYLPSNDSKDSINRIYDLRGPSKVYYGGEIGFLYGKSTGKYGREDIAGYIIGTVGTDHFSITAGYYRQDSNFSISRHR
jgi:hypothetical protein